MTVKSVESRVSAQVSATTANVRPLAELRVGERGRIVSVGAQSITQAAKGMDPLEQRLLEMGFEEGSEIELAHIGIIGGNPLAVRIHGTLIALRKGEAAAILVESLGPADG